VTWTLKTPNITAREVDDLVPARFPLGTGGAQPPGAKSADAMSCFNAASSGSVSA